MSAQAPSPNHFLRGATRKSSRPSAYATTTPYALPSTTRPSLPEDLIQARDRNNSRPSIVESPSLHYSQIPPQESAPPVSQPACLTAPKRERATTESTLNTSSKFTRVPTQAGVGKPTLRPAGKVISPRRYGQVLYTSTLSPEADRKASQLPFE